MIIRPIVDAAHRGHCAELVEAFAVADAGVVAAGVGMSDRSDGRVALSSRRAVRTRGSRFSSRLA